MHRNFAVLGRAYSFVRLRSGIPTWEPDFMSLLEAEHRRSQRARRKQRKRQDRKRKVWGRPAGLGHNLGPSLAGLHDDRVLTFRQWAALNSLGERTARRLLKSGRGPPVVQLSDRRIGVTVRANRAWQEARAR